jgi:hypothetical protein
MVSWYRCQPTRPDNSAPAQVSAAMQPPGPCSPEVSWCPSSVLFAASPVVAAPGCVRLRLRAGRGPSRTQAARARRSTAYRAPTGRRRSGTRACPARQSASSKPPGGRTGAAAVRLAHGAAGPQVWDAARRRRAPATPVAGCSPTAAASARRCAVRNAAGGRRWVRLAGSARAAPVDQAGAPCPPRHSLRRPNGDRFRRWNVHLPRARAGGRSSPHSTPYRGPPVHVTTKYGSEGFSGWQHESSLGPQKVVENSRFGHHRLILASGARDFRGVVARLACRIPVTRGLGLSARSRQEDRIHRGACEDRGGGSSALRASRSLNPPRAPNPPCSAVISFVLLASRGVPAGSPVPLHGDHECSAVMAHRCCVADNANCRTTRACHTRAFRTYEGGRK